MQYKAKYTEKTEKEVDIILPIFRKLSTTYGTTKYYAAFPDNTASFIQLFAGNKTLPPSYLVQSGGIPNVVTDITEAFAKWETIEPDEFFDAYNKAIDSLTIHPPEPYLNKEEADDLKNIF